jgi:eukaryotic-like serine/threonine-protein kinase
VNSDLYQKDANGAKAEELLVKSSELKSPGSVSPDGHFVAYRSDESGSWEIYVRPFSPDSGATQSTTGGKWQISNGGGIRPSWSPDGKELYYLTPDAKVMVVPVSTRPTFQAGAPKFLFQAQSGRIVGDTPRTASAFCL